MSAAPTVLIVPGLRGHVADHWQTLLETELPKAVTVPRMEGYNLSCAAWVKALDKSLAAIEGPVILVAHSAGAMMVVHWAAKHRRPIQGALLAAPPDFESPLPEGYPEEKTLRDNGWLPTPMQKLPFPSIVAASTNDPLARFTRSLQMARAWGSRVVRIGNVGHLNPASGYGRWPKAHEFIAELSAASTETLAR
jgi:predicted alpha/beta hydrolase family esterase